MKQKRRSVLSYAGSIPAILKYQIITKLALAALAYALRLLRSAVLWTSTRSAISSGDLTFIIQSVQGWILILLGLVTLSIYMVFDINAMILLSDRVVHQEEIYVRKIIRGAFASLKRFRSLTGLLLLIYVAFIVPLAGGGMGLSITQNLYVPNFITSVIYSNRLFTTLYSTGTTLLFIVSIYYIFTFHSSILGGRDAREALRHAGGLMRRNWKQFLSRYVRFFIATALAGIAVVTVTGAILFGTASLIDFDIAGSLRVMITFISLLVISIAGICLLLFQVCQFIELTRLYHEFAGEDDRLVQYPERRFRLRMILAAAIFVLGVFLVSVLAASGFDTLFPELERAQVVAHRAGGNLGNENTVYGLEQAIAAGADVGEIDVQRTGDGYYVINHDKNFQRLAGEPRKAQEMTLEEIRELRVEDLVNGSGRLEPVPTLEEMLDAANGRIQLYVELKGVTADQQMADDLYQMVQEKGMLDSVTFIGLDYPLLSYVETTYPDANTGYLCYAAAGDVEYLNVDVLILEEEMATPENIAKVHAAGKQVAVWTVNSTISIVRYYARSVDAIVTDEVSQSLFIRRRIFLEEFEDVGLEDVKDIIRVFLNTLFVFWV